MEQETRKSATSAQKNIAPWVIVAVLVVAIVIVTAWLYMQNKDTQPSEKTITDAETESQSAPTQETPYETQEQTTSGEISFDGCGALSKYENENWYAELTKNTTLTTVPLKTNEDAPENTATLQDVSDACFSENGHFLVMLIPGRYAQGPTIYRFNTEAYQLDRALLIDNDRGVLSSPDQFGERENNIIHLEGTSGDAGFGSTMHFEYDFVNNTVELKKEYSFSADDPDNGKWYYY